MSVAQDVKSQISVREPGNAAVEAKQGAVLEDKAPVAAGSRASTTAALVQNGGDRVSSSGGEQHEAEQHGPPESKISDDGPSVPATKDAAAAQAPLEAESKTDSITNGAHRSAAPGALNGTKHTEASSTNGTVSEDDPSGIKFA